MSDQATTLLMLVRHAVTAETGPVLSGRRPIELSEEGRQQAAAVARRLAALPLAAVYASPVERAAQTARAIATFHGLEVQVLEGVEEADYGDWSGRSLKDLAGTELWRRVQIAPSQARFPNGEAIAEMQERASLALQHVVEGHPGGVVAVVSHADVIKAAVAHFLGVDLDHFQRLAISPASVTVLAFGKDGPVLVKLNDTGELAELRPEPAEAPGG
jgi:probable phosphomutase (TIGR03848 family)